MDNISLTSRFVTIKQKATFFLYRVPDDQQLDSDVLNQLKGKYLAMTNGTGIYTFTVQSAWYENRNVIVEPIGEVIYISMLIDGWEKHLQRRTG